MAEQLSFFKKKLGAFIYAIGLSQNQYATSGLCKIYLAVSVVEQIIFYYQFRFSTIV
jgi:hypothetical protein